MKQSRSAPILEKAEARFLRSPRLGPLQKNKKTHCEAFEILGKKKRVRMMKLVGPSEVNY